MNQSAGRQKRRKNYVVVSNRAYGNALKGTRIYFEGKKPKGLGKDGKIALGKHILELLRKTFRKFRWILTEATDSVSLERGIYRIRTSQKRLKEIQSQSWERSADIKNEVVKRHFSLNYPEHFGAAPTSKYAAGTLARTLSKDIVTRLSSEDRDALNAFLPQYIASESTSSVNLLKASTQIRTLKELSADLEAALAADHSEAWWQQYVHGNILIIQQGYIEAIEKLNISIGDTKFPDFVLVTHDGYLDILEIKKPQTKLLKKDGSRGNYYWDSEVAKAVIQVENYIEKVSGSSDKIRSYLLDFHKIDMKVVRPRGIILAGDGRKFADQKERDDFRLMSQSTKNIIFVTYDELLSRLKNYIEVLQKHSVTGANPAQ